jgi:hypothetical protein
MWLRRRVRNFIAYHCHVLRDCGWILWLESALQLSASPLKQNNSKRSRLTIGVQVKSTPYCATVSRNASCYVLQFSFILRGWGGGIPPCYTSPSALQHIAVYLETSRCRRVSGDWDVVSGLRESSGRGDDALDVKGWREKGLLFVEKVGDSHFEGHRISGRTLFRLLGKDLGRHLRLILTNKAWTLKWCWWGC